VLGAFKALVLASLRPTPVVCKPSIKENLAPPLLFSAVLFVGSLPRLSVTRNRVGIKMPLFIPFWILQFQGRPGFSSSIFLFPTSSVLEHVFMAVRRVLSSTGHCLVSFPAVSSFSWRFAAVHRYIRPQTVSPIPMRRPIQTPSDGLP